METGQPLAKESLFYEDDYKGQRLVGAFDIRAVKLGDGFAAAWRDITERKRAEQALRLQAAALTSAANAIVITDRDGRITWANPAFTDLTGYALEEAVGQSPRILKSGKHDQPFYEHLWDTILSGQVWHGALTNRRKDGSLYEDEQTITPVRDERGEITHFIAIKQDITLRKQAEEALQRAREELEGKVERGMLRKNPYGLTFREFTVLYLVAAGRTDKEIASELGISPLTAHKHVANILGKMNATSRTGAGVRAVREGLLD